MYRQQNSKIPINERMLDQIINAYYNNTLDQLQFPGDYDLPNMPGYLQWSNGYASGYNLEQNDRRSDMWRGGFNGVDYNRGINGGNLQYSPAQNQNLQSQNLQNQGWQNQNWQNQGWQNWAQGLNQGLQGFGQGLQGLTMGLGQGLQGVTQGYQGLQGLGQNLQNLGRGLWGGYGY